MLGVQLVREERPDMSLSLLPRSPSVNLIYVIVASSETSECYLQQVLSSDRQSKRPFSLPVLEVEARGDLKRDVVDFFF